MTPPKGDVQKSSESGSGSPPTLAKTAGEPSAPSSTTATADALSMSKTSGPQLQSLPSPGSSSSSSSSGSASSASDTTVVIDPFSFLDSWPPINWALHPRASEMFQDPGLMRAYLNRSGFQVEIQHGVPIKSAHPRPSPSGSPAEQSSTTKEAPPKRPPLPSPPSGEQDLDEVASINLPSIKTNPLPQMSLPGPIVERAPQVVPRPQDAKVANHIRAKAKVKVRRYHNYKAQSKSIP